MTDPAHPATTAWLMSFIAWLVAPAATLGALFVGKVMGQGALSGLLVSAGRHVPARPHPRHRAQPAAGPGYPFR